MNKKKVTLAFGILSMNLLLMSTSVLGSAIAAISKSFPTEPISKVQMITSIPQLGQLIATLIFTWLTYHLTRKNIGIVSVLIVALSGLIPAFFPSSLNLILACMTALGFGTGLISNVGPVLLQEHFEGEERASVMGWAVGFNNIGMMVFTAVGGILGASNWHNLFWIYGLSFIILIAFWIIVPQDKRISPKDSLNTETQKTSFWSNVKSLNVSVYVILLITFVLSLILMTFMANQSIVLAGKGKGTAYTAIVIAIGNVGGILTAFSLKYIRKLTKTNTMAYGFIAFALSFICIEFFSNPVLHVLGNMFSGMGVVMVNATIPFELSLLADESKFPIVISMNTLVSSIAGVIAPMILAGMKIKAGVPSFTAGIVLSVIVSLLLFITRFGSKIEKKQ
ncbi:MAG: MFS transporter [Lactobacillus sp.]|uniref:MFS transporter n=1 Tax=Bombilactobacillus bombi TaxID=1303590 RepID=A0A417ZHY9_9LACO|nr:MFS transporter [Bombilactobacillus bombi]MCO6541105.1 MFS transporter [Lactobacillus sp.]MCO6543365.1 MFS transporter [Lactobacillus sp.]RHW51190.1 MFS transporter [Bombilactobacillus bombi]